MGTVSVQVVSVGRTEIPGPELFWMRDWDRWYPLTFNVVIARDESAGRVVLVNSGGPDDLSAMNAKWTGMFGERGAFLRGDDETLSARLASVGLGLADVTDVVVTPFQLYSTGGLLALTNARYHLSKRGWVHFHTTHDHPHDDRWTSLSPELVHHLTIDAWDRVHLLEDDDEIVPGVRTWFSGTHHRASVAVEIDSSAGVVVASDSFFYYDNVEDGRLLGINENMYEALATNERARRVADHLVPLYDPRVFERYPDGVIAK